MRHILHPPTAPAVLTLALLSFLVLVQSTGGQMSTPSASPEFPRPGASRTAEEDDPFRTNAALRSRLEHSRAGERQRRIVDDANRLVELTVQYRHAVDEHGTVTADDQKLLTQIEKLAREVKDRMRGM